MKLQAQDESDDAMKELYDGEVETLQSTVGVLQSDLDDNQPIIYVGYSNEGGHAWNIDGYQDDYFHSNFGWGGSNNGYYLLSAMNGFNSGQGALINIVPEVLDEPHVVLMETEYFEMEGDGDQVINPGETVGYLTTIENSNDFVEGSFTLTRPLLLRGAIIPVTPPWTPSPTSLRILICSM